MELNPQILRDFKNWVFFPGMLFQSQKKWWDSGGKRDKPHEGVDLLLYRTKKGGIKRLDTGIVIPSIFEGIVLSVEPDFLGDSVFVLSNKSELFVVGHVKVMDGLKEGKEIKKGDPLGFLDGFEGNERKVPQHIHISFAFTLSRPPRKMNWDLMSQKSVVKLFDPMPYLAREYELIEKRDKLWKR